MDWNTAKRLALALLEEMDFDPLKVIGLSDDDLADKLGFLAEDLAEALLTFSETLSDTSQMREAAKRYAERPKDATDLARWQKDSQKWSASHHRGPSR